MRTEEEILQGFNKLGYTEIYVNKPYYIEMENDKRCLTIDMEENKSVVKYYDHGWEFLAEDITLEEFKLLHELFECWGWL